MIGKNGNKPSLLTAFRYFCLLGGLSLLGLAYFAEEWLAEYMEVELAWTLGFVMLLLLPVSLVFHFGSKRMSRSLRKSGKRAARKKAREKLPVWAEQRGLEFREADERDAVGTALGDYQGYKLLVDVDAGDLSARWASGLGSRELDVSTTPPPTIPPGELVEFDTGDEQFDEVFQTRFADEDTADLVEASTGLREALVEFWEAHAGALEELNIDSQGVVCFLDADSQYDVEVVGRLVEALVGAMGRVEAEL